MIALIDGDILVYQSAFRHETSIDFGDGELMSQANVGRAQQDLDDHIARICEEVGATRAVLALTDRDKNFRKDVYPDYKKPRGITKRPLGWRALRDYVMASRDCYIRPGLEADDVLGILATGKIRGFRGDRVVCSIDKDLRTIPGRLYNWEKPERGVVEISEEEADREFMLQVLCGDRTDNYPGCPGIGRVRAERLLSPVGHGLSQPAWLVWWLQVVEAFEKKGLTPDDALVQARCARILRAEDYDFEKREVILWGARLTD